MTLREAWTGLIAPEDYDAHMAQIGQAQANASLVGELFHLAPPPAGSRVLIAGAGTGQMFGYLPPALFHPYRLLCSDLNPGFLEVLRRRHVCETVIDDIEDSRLEPGFGAIVVVLVLEHVDWCRALASLAKLRPERLMIVVQRNPPGVANAVTATATRLAASLRTLSGPAQPKLVPVAELTRELSGLGFPLTLECSREVAGARHMVALVFAPASDQARQAPAVLPRSLV